MKNKPHKLWVLFLTTLYISAFTFGGGFVIVTFMKHKFVDELHWIDEQEMLDFTALAQSCPGAIAVNAAILVGWNVYGFAGMIVATLGTILPPMIILSVVSFFYAIFSTNVWVAVVLKGMQAGVAAVILDAACSLGESVLKEKSSLSIFIMTAAFVCDFFLGVNVSASFSLYGISTGHFFSGKHRRKHRNKNAYRRRNYDLYTIISEFRTDWAF